MQFDDFLNKRYKGSLATATDWEMVQELQERKKDNVFPLSVFHPMIKPFMSTLIEKYDIPRSYIGLSMLCAYSSAIGTAYSISTNGINDIYFPIWGCMNGISSSGKSLAYELCYFPLLDIQKEFDHLWEQETQALSDEKKAVHSMRTIVFRDVQLPTLMRYVMPDSAKGLVKYTDEILEWINAMNGKQGRDSIDEQFWLSSWNCKAYSGVRAGKQKFVVNRPFITVLGGIQPSIMFKLFAKDRDTTGFVFRILFANSESKMANPDILYKLPEELKKTHQQHMARLYNELPVYDQYATPKKCHISQDAFRLYNKWVQNRIISVNRMSEIREREIHSGILGKMKEYALRFAGILCVSDHAYEMMSNPFSYWKEEEEISVAVMERALLLADYFYQAAADVHETVETKMTAPPEVLLAASMFRNQHSYSQIARVLYKDEKMKMKAHRQIKAWIKEYPKIFQAKNT
jgi:hypothetical protein